MKKIYGILILLFSLSLNLNGQAGESAGMPEAEITSAEVSDAVVTVGKSKITHQQLYSKLYNLFGQEVLSRMVEELIIFEEAERRDLSVSEKELEKEIASIRGQFQNEESFNRFLELKKLTLEDLKRQVKADLLKKKMVKDDYGLKVKKSEIEEYFEQNKDAFSTPRQAGVAHILCEELEDAEDIIIALRAGASFEKMALAKSVDRSSAQNGGAIGYFSKGMLNKDLEDIILSMEEGEISEPVRTEQGWHIIKITEIREARQARLDKDLSERIGTILLNNKIAEKYPEWLEKVRNNLEE